MADLERIQRRRAALEAWKNHRKQCPECQASAKCEKEEELYFNWVKEKDDGY